MKLTSHAGTLLKCLRLPVLAAGLAACGTLYASDKTISGNYTVAAGGESYDNVTVTATATISGGPLAIADGGTIAVSAGTASFTCPVTMGTSSSGTVTIAPAAGATADFTGKISGPADIDIHAAANNGIVKFTSSDSDYDGNLTLTKGAFRAKGDGAFGSTNGTSTFVDLAATEACVYFDGFTTSEHIILSQSSPSVGDGYGKQRVFFTANCTFNGEFTDGTHKGAEWGWNFTDGITVNFNGTFSGFGDVMGAKTAACTATINFNCSPSYSGTWYWMGCTLNMHQRRANGGPTAFRGGTHNFYEPNHFMRTSDDAVSRMHFESADAATFNLINGEQTFAYFSEKTAGNSANAIITSASGQTLRLTNTSASTYAGKFSGNVNLSVQGSQTVTLSGQSDTTGTLALSNTAKVVLASSADWCGKLAFQNADGTQLLTLNGDISVSGLRIAGTDMPDGTYGSSSSSAPAANRLSCFAGSGTVTVAHDLVIDTATYVVPSGGETCQNVSVLANATITGGKLTVLGSGISVAAGKTARFENEVSFGADGGSGTVSISPAAGATANFVGKLTGPSAIEIRAADRTGVVRFAPASGVTSDFDGNLTVIRGEFHAAGNSSLGSTAGYTRFVNTLTGGVIDNLIYFDGLTTSETIYLSRGTVSWSDTYRKAILFTANCTFNGPILAPGVKDEFGWDFANNITINFNGGLGTTSAPFGSLAGNDSGANGTTFNFNASPHVSGNWYWLHGINNMNCQVLGAYNASFRGGTYHLNCANVFVTEAGGFKKMNFENGDAMTFDLVQGVQTFTYIVEKSSGYSRLCVITSSTGQSFKLTNGSQDSVFRGSFTGNVNLDVAGDKTVTLYGQSDSSGTLSLSNSAKVVFASGARWTGKLAFQDDTGSQLLTLNNGGMTISELWIGGERMPNGDYGSATSGVPAERQLACLGGTDVLTVGDSYGVLVVNGASYAVAVVGETYSGVIVSNNATITGGKLTVLDGGEIATAAGKTATFAGEVAFGTQGNYPLVIAPEAGATNIFTGKLTGPSDIEIRAANQTGSVSFTPASGVTSDFDGNLTIIRGAFHAAGDSSLGSTAGYTRFVNTLTGGVNDNRIFFDGMTTSERIYLSRGSVGWSNDYTIRFTADCTFNGLITSPSPCSEYGWAFANGITLDFNGGLGTESAPFGALIGSDPGNCTATVNFNCSPWLSGTWYWKGSTNEMNHPVCGTGGLRFRGACYYHLNCPNTFVLPAGGSKPAIFENGNVITFDLVTGSQKFTSLTDKTAGFSDKVVFTSSTGQDVHLDGATGSYTFRGRFTGNVNLLVDAAQTLTLTNRSTSTGTLALTNGAKVVFTPTGSWAGRISIAGDGDEMLTLNGTLPVSQLVVGGQTLAPGWYGPTAPIAANRLACIDGEGLLAVGLDGATDGVWTAGAGSSATGIDQGSNWQSGAEPDGVSGLAAVTFATAGTAAGITHDVFWRQLTFSSAVPFFRLYGDSGITLAEGVSVESDGTQSLSYEIAAPLTTVGTQSWSIPSNTTLAVKGDLHGAPGTEIVCGGFGTYSFEGANSDTAADIRFEDSAQAYPKSVKAFGSAAGTTTMAGKGHLVLDNLVTDEPFVFLGNAANSAIGVSVRPGTNVLSGPLSIRAPVYIRDFNNGRRLVFSGGIDFNVPADNRYFQIGWFGEPTRANPFQIEITGTAITNSGSHSIRFYNEAVCDVIFSVASNRLTGTGSRSIVQMTRNDMNAAGEPTARLFCKVPHVFDYNATLLLGYDTKSSKPYCGFIDLCGNDQGFAAAYGHGADVQSFQINGKPQGAYSIVTSTNGPALLCSRHTGDVSTWWTFKGAAGYRMEGPGGITLMTSSESTGALCVTNGTMTIPAGVSWKNCAKVEASDNGTFCLEESRAFGPGTEVRLSGNGKMNLASGVQATAGFLFLDGNEKPLLGDWGSPESGAAHTSSHFTGTGKIRFGSQFIIIFR